MADVRLNTLAAQTPGSFLVKSSTTQNQGTEGWMTKTALEQMIRDEIKTQLSAITSGTPDVPVLDGSTLKYMTLANFAKVAGGLTPNGAVSSDFNADNITENGVYILYGRGNGAPSKYGILIVIRAISVGNYSYWGLQLFFNASTKKIHFRIGLDGQNAYGSWSDGV